MPLMDFGFELEIMLLHHACAKLATVCNLVRQCVPFLSPGQHVMCIKSAVAGPSRALANLEARAKLA